MSRFLIVLLTALSLLAMPASDADARRMGGGRSIGKQSSNVSRQQAPAQPGANQPKPATPAAAPAGAPAPKPASPWKGMLGGALLGLGLGALLSGMGIGGGMANIISILLMAGMGIALVMFLMRFFGQKQRPELSPVMGNNGNTGNAGNTYSRQAEFTATPEIGSRINEYSAQPSHAGGSPGAESAATWEIPADFDVAQFERTAKGYFIRLQAAWDKADINDIREFTTPEMYAEIKLDLDERGATQSVTEVITINAKLLGIETLETSYQASVRFVGTIKEELNGPTQSFEEVWNLTKTVAGQGGWLLAGIQQMS